MKEKTEITFLPKTKNLSQIKIRRLKINERNR